MNALPVRQPGDLGRYLGGWGLSLCVHSLAAAGAFALLADLRLVPQPAPFRWEVALMDTPTAAEPATAAEAPPDPAPPPAPRPVQTQPLVQTAQPIRTVEPVQTVKPVEQVVRQEVRQEIAPAQPILQAPAQPILQAKVPSVSPVEERRPVQTAPVQQPPLTREREAEPAPAPVEEATPVEQAEPARPVTRPVVAAAAPVTHAEPSVVPKPVPEAVPTAPVVQAAVQERPAAASSAQPAPTPVERAPVNQQVSQQVTQQVAMAQPAAKADFGWLGEALWHRVLQLKRYPPEARMRGVEGRVVLRVVIGDDGHLRDLHVIRSSGSELLDRDAMEVIKQACPLKLAHPLGRPQVAVQIPINYRLER